MIAEDEKEATLFLALTSQGVSEADVEDFLKIFNEGSSEEILRSMGVDDDFFVGALEGFKMTFPH